ncbi:patatin family protein [Paenibacillus antri]|uniref:Patatin family protein n=1 Tax=Paenibacillus antri TaxID=2582848 RepID=A0A5R9G312_9BACL|nr:patatin family protein [Paenibacillus antri]TLS50221.1 patatin family protein [Paenibacillus antri]
MEEKLGLVLEGGGMRGVYTGGVLERFMEDDLYFPYVIGVSAGACNAVSYLSRQRGRNRRVTIDYVGHPEYLSIRNWIRKGSMFGMDFIFDRIPNEIDLLDYETLFKIRETFVAGTTDPETGEPAYFANDVWARDKQSFMAVLRASSSLPFFSPPVDVAGKPMYDGGVADPIPVRKALEDGCDRVVVVLTKDATYRIKPFKRRRLAGWIYRKYPKLVEAMIRRERVYNDTMALVRRLEAEGRAFVLQPSKALPVGRMEKDKALLGSLYELGESDAEAARGKLRSWIASGAPAIVK